MSLQEEERLHTARYVTCFLLVQLSRSFPRNGMPGYPLWQRNRPLGAVLKLYRRLFSVEDDLADADFVIAASSDEVLNAKISDYCRQKKIPVNVVDVKDECSFIFPSMLQEALKYCHIQRRCKPCSLPRS